MDSVHWSREDIVRLTEELRSRPVLWDVSSELYRNRVKKRDALLEIAQIFDRDAGDVERKIQNLKTQFHREDAKIRSRSMSNNPEDQYATTWFAYNKLLFLSGTRSHGSKSIRNPLNLTEKTTLKEEKTSDDSNSRILEDSHTDESADHKEFEQNRHTLLHKLLTGEQPRTIHSLKRKYEAPHLKLDRVKHVSVTERTVRDEHSIFGEYVAQQIRNLKDSYSQAIARFKISQVLFEVETEQYKAYHEEGQEYVLPQSNVTD